MNIEKGIKTTESGERKHEGPLRARRCPQSLSLALYFLAIDCVVSLLFTRATQ